jgi:hypothetical protein
MEKCEMYGGCWNPPDEEKPLIPLDATACSVIFAVSNDGGKQARQRITKTNTTMINREIVAKELYETYCTAAGGVAFNGDPLPGWDAFAADPTKEKQSSAWLAAADRAMSLLL